MNDPPKSWTPSLACREAARRAAESILKKIFGDKARTLSGQRPSFIVYRNSIVTASDIDAMASSITTCPHCSFMHLAYDENSDECGPPRSIFVGISVLVPVELLPESVLGSAVEPKDDTGSVESMDSMIKFLNS